MADNDTDDEEDTTIAGMFNKRLYRVVMLFTHGNGLSTMYTVCYMHMYIVALQ